MIDHDISRNRHNMCVGVERKKMSPGKPYPGFPKEPILGKVLEQSVPSTRITVTLTFEALQSLAL